MSQIVTTKQDKLTAGRLRELLHYEPETGAFTRRVGSGHARAGDMAGSVHRTGYVRISIDGGKYTAHHLAWLYVQRPTEVEREAYFASLVAERKQRFGW